MSVVVVTGSGGLIGSEAAAHYAASGFDVVGIDNDMRRTFFGEGASTRWMRERLEREQPRYRHSDADIRDFDAVSAVFGRYGRDIALVVHAAAQPSHDWAAKEPTTDFGVNATGTLHLLEATRRHCPDAAFIFTSTNKVYGDTPNRLPLVEQARRWEIAADHPFAGGIDESMSVDMTTHSLFGVSKTAADLLVQEYGRYFGMKTVCFRGGCLTGPNHSPAMLHGFLAYLMKCVATGAEYTIFGYGGKQVRDNIHSRDLVAAFDAFFAAPRQGEVYNMGGGRACNCSMLEAIALCEEIAGRSLHVTYRDEPRIGDHIWYISSTKKFERDYPTWSIRVGLRDLLEEIYAVNSDRWAPA
ncbi:MAG TPA: NAD-dependent epimerase/dehydratase family protein [Vicinamibacterales bacterium]|nr:NAD-dependent epimerase/dehydratase family protein [Vicinamibacterales bacterium]